MDQQHLESASSMTGAIEPALCVHAGVLLKYVNMAKGWRDRLFVLANKKLVYYKLSGKRAVNVQSVLDHYDPSGNNIRLIGAKIRLLLKEKRNGVVSAAMEPAVSYDLHSSSLRESHTESTKFYVQCPGSSACTVRTETSDDRLAWVSALAGQKLFMSGKGPQVQGSSSVSRPLAAMNGRLAAPQPQLTTATKLAEDLRQKEAMADPSCQRLIVALQKEIRDADAALQEKDRQIQQLMDERRQLQTELVTESQRLDHLPDELASGRETSSSQNDEEDEDNMSVVGSNKSMTLLYQRQFSERDGDVFFDAVEPSRSKHSRAAESPQGTPERVTERTTTASPSRSPETAAVASGVSPSPKGASSQPAPTAPSSSGAPQWLAAEPTVKRRLALPEPKETQKSVSLWSIIKECIGKDLTRICLPVYFNEPLSALQRMVEEVEYSYLLDRAATCPKGSTQRLAWLAAFAVSGYASADGRTAKPFNPLLGETYELVDKERRFRFLAEKVVHHPTVLAAHCEGPGWALDGDLEIKSKFWGRCIELKPFGKLEVKFHDGEVLSWNKVPTTINNLILGKIYVDFAGTMRVTSNVHKNEMRVKFKDTGSMFGASKRLVSGSSFEGGVERPAFKMEGVWSDYLKMDTGSGMETVWKAAAPPADPTRYNLTQFAIQLNELTPGLQEKLPPTDCRFRPDQSSLEQGFFDKANAEKQRLEKKQRKARKEAEEGVPIVSRWFEPVASATRGEELSYKYKGGYWEQREAGVYTDCRDIFGPDL